ASGSSSFAKRLPHHSFTIPQTPQFFQQENPNSRTSPRFPTDSFVFLLHSLIHPSLFALHCCLLFNL
ncbi:hypothetical protein L2E82_38840, partial [Cichorium intybus]